MKILIGASLTSKNLLKQEEPAQKNRSLAYIYNSYGPTNGKSILETVNGRIDEYVRGLDTLQTWLTDGSYDTCVLTYTPESSGTKTETKNALLDLM